MAYNKPGWFVRNVYNRVAKTFGLGGSEQLEVVGRATGSAQSVPVTPVEVAGTTYLVSVRGDAEWVRNLEAAGRAGTLVGKKRRRAFTASPVADPSPVIAAYRAKVGTAIDPIWNKLPDDKDHPVYALTF